MSQKVYDEQYERQLMEYFDSCLPDKIYDAHFHLSRSYTKECGFPGTPYQQYSEFMEKYLGRKLCGGMVMAQPSSKHSEKDLDDENTYNLMVAKEQRLAAGLLVKPGCGREKTEQKFNENPELRVLKPYLTYSVGKDKYESDILDFAPEWMWEFVNDKELPILIHLSHYQNMLSDPKNVEQIRYLSKKYPRAKIILAHCAMGHHVRKLKVGLEQISDLQNIWFDCSGAAETMSIYYCMKTFGVERMMYGGDYDHAEKVGRICSFGSNFIGFHEDYIKEEVLPPDYRYQPLNNGQECLLALLEAGELLGLSSGDMEKIFYGNAVSLFAKEE